MSIDALRWAFQQQNITSSQKLVLLALADRADASDECYPSIAQIRLDTCLKADTICSATRALEVIGLITRQRRHNNSTVYRLVGVPSRHQIPETGNDKVNSRNRGSAIPETGNSTYPETGKLTTNKPPLNHQEKPAKTTGEPVEPPHGIHPDAWAAWTQHRREIRKKLTPSTIERQAAMLRAYSPDEQRQIIEQSIEAGWAGLFPLKNNNRSTPHETRERSHLGTAGRIADNARRELAAAAATRDHAGTLDHDGPPVRTQVVELIRGGS